VMGRTKILIASTTERNGAKYQGLPLGSTLESVAFFGVINMTVAPQKIRAALKFTDKIVVTGRL
jgi:hypothetical protein